MLNTLNNPYLTLLALSLLCGLAWYSQRDYNHGYPPSAQAEMDRIMQGIIISNMTPKEQMRYLYGE